MKLRLRKRFPNRLNYFLGNCSHGVMIRRHRILLLLLGFVSFCLFAYVQIATANGYEITGSFNNLFTKFPNTLRNVKREFAKRESCPPIYGKVVVFVMFSQTSIDHGYYTVALESLHCYLKGTDYELKMVDIDKDERVRANCSHHKQIFFKKHCAAAQFLKDGDWLLVLDADTGVVNPHHCIEEWIDTRVNLLFYERFFNWEIASGNYLAKNTKYSFDFLIGWANYEFKQPANWNGADNGALQIHLLRWLIPDATQEIENCDFLWHNGTDYETYMAYVICVKTNLGAIRLWPGKIRIYRRAHGWVRDGFLSSDSWGPSDFMFHGWKNSFVGENGWDSPFTKNLNISNCGLDDSGWLWREEKKLSDEKIRGQLKDFERSAAKTFPKAARVFPYLSLVDVGDCFPFCENKTDISRSSL